VDYRRLHLVWLPLIGRCTTMSSDHSEVRVITYAVDRRPFRIGHSGGFTPSPLDPPLSPLLLSRACSTTHPRSSAPRASITRIPRCSPLMRLNPGRAWRTWFHMSRRHLDCASLGLTQKRPVPESRHSGVRSPSCEASAIYSRCLTPPLHAWLSGAYEPALPVGLRVAPAWAIADLPMPISTLDRRPHTLALEVFRGGCDTQLAARCLGLHTAVRFERGSRDCARAITPFQGPRANSPHRISNQSPTHEVRPGNRYTPSRLRSCPGSELLPWAVARTHPVRSIQDHSFRCTFATARRGSPSIAPPTLPHGWANRTAPPHDPTP